MFRSHILAASACLAIVPTVSVIQAQEATAPAVAAAAPAAAAPAGLAAAAAPRPSIWSFLGVPQTARGLRTLRGRVVNRRGNFPGLERKPPVLPLTAPENLESPNPAIKAAAEIKKAEDMKKQKIKAIKYLASLGCGCYDKDGKITDALLAATDDCTPDVRLAAIEAVEDNVNKSCCKSCGTKSCCNEKISKRLSEMAYERDDDGCLIESSAEIRRAAARVLKKCCPGGLYTGPIEEELQEVDESDPVEMIPAPEPDQEPVKDPEPEEEIPGESVDEEEGIAGESDDESGDQDSMDLEDDREDPFKDPDPEDLETPDGEPEADADDLILRRVQRNSPVEFHFADSMSQPEVNQLEPPANSSALVPVLVEARKPKPAPLQTLQLNAATPAATVYSKPARQSKPHLVIEASPVSVIRKSTRIHRQPLAETMVEPTVKPMMESPAKPPVVPEPEVAPVVVPSQPVYQLPATQSAAPVLRDKPVVLAPRSIPIAKRMPRNEAVPVVRPTSYMKAEDSPRYRIAEKKQSVSPSLSRQRSSNRQQTSLDPNQRFSAYGDIVSIDQNTGQVLLKPLKHQGIRVGVRAEVVRFSAQGSRVLGTVELKIVGRTIVTAQVSDPNLLHQIQATDKFVCRY